MGDYRIEIVFVACDFAFETRDTIADPLDIELQEASLGMVTGGSTTGDTLTIIAETNQDLPARQLIRSLLRALDVAPSTRIHLLNCATGEHTTLNINE